jgi:cell division protein FtsN
MVDETQPEAVFEDVYTAGQNQDQASPYDFTSYDKPPATPIDTFRPGTSRQREAEGYVEPAEQDFVGWPVLPEGAEEEEEESRNGRGGLFLRIGLVVGLVGVVCFWAYYFLGDFIAKRIGRQEQAAALTSDPTATPGASDQGVSQTPEPQVAPDTQGSRPLPGGEPGSQESGSTQTAGSKDEVAKLFQAPPQSPPTDKVLTLKPAPKSERQNKSAGGAENPVKVSPLSAGISNRSRLTIQVGSFKDQGEADARASGLNAATDGAFHVVRADIPGRGVWYRVQQVSGFASREAAFSYGNQLRTKNLISDFIVTLR